MSETRTLARLIAETGYGDFPAGAVEAGKRAIRDYAGVALYGSRHAVGEQVAAHVDRSAPGEDATLLGGGAASATGAALANGAFGHAVDYDDTFESIVLHPTSPTFPAALAAAELDGGNGRDALAGYLLGVETAYRVGHATYPAHYDQGFHATGTIGTFGAAAAAASALSLPPDEVEHALGIAASSASSLKANFGSMTKPYHAGHAAEAGLRAALLARVGFTAAEGILEGELGYGRVMTPDDSYDPDEVHGGEWAIHDVGFKPYPSGVITHAAMEALRGLRERHDLGPDDVERVVVTLDSAADEMLIHARPEDGLQAKFSIEFCLAAVLREGDVGIEAFTEEYVRAPETRRLVERVERDFEPELFGGEFAGYGARVIVETDDGRQFEAEQRRAPGGPANPLSAERQSRKFRECATAVLDPAAAERVEAAVMDLDEAGALDRFLAAVR